jgi:5-methylcytosine-specific restriction endonuclease McrA
MRIPREPLPPIQDVLIYRPSFGYSHPLKTAWKKGQIPQVKYGFYGEKLTKKNVSLEHLKPISKGGKTEWSNLVLADNKINNARGDKPLEDYLNLKAMGKYLEQFKNIKIKGFDGNRYIAMILETVGGLINV